MIWLSGSFSRTLRSTIEAVGDLQVAEFAGESHVAHHRASDEGDLAAVPVGGVEDLLDPVNMAGEAGHDDPLGRCPEHLIDRRGQFLLGGGESGDLRVRRVDEHQVDALLAEPGERPKIGDPFVERELVELEVTGMQDQARRGTDRHGQGVRDRVVHRHELTIERPELLSTALRDFDRLRLDAVLLELRADERQRELRPDERDVRPFAQQVGHAADVVLMPVGQHDRGDLVEAVPDPGEVGQDHVDPGLGLLGEQHAAVDDQQPSAVLEHGHVAPDLAQAAQRHDSQATLVQPGRGLQFRVRVAHPVRTATVSDVVPDRPIPAVRPSELSMMVGACGLRVRLTLTR